MKKINTIVAVAKIAASVSALAMAVSATQVSASNAVAGISDSDPTDHIADARKSLETTMHLTDELVGIMTSEHASDPIDMDNFDIDVVGAKLRKAGLISDMTSWNDAAGKIESDGFAAYLDDLKLRASTLNQQLAGVDQKIGAWMQLDYDQRIAAIYGNTDDNIVPVLAKIKIDAQQFDAFAHAGKMVFAELTQSDSAAGQVAEAKQRDLVDA
jgi:hypothetical protein